MTDSDHVFDAAIDVAYKYHRSIGIDTFLASAERAVGHIALHNLNAVFVVHVNACHFIEGHDIPSTYQTHLMTAHVVEQIGHRGLST